MSESRVVLRRRASKRTRAKSWNEQLVFIDLVENRGYFHLDFAGPTD